MSRVSLAPGVGTARNFAQESSNDMKPLKVLLIPALCLASLLIASVAATQEDSSFQSREQNFREYTTLLRTDIKAQRKAIITQLMHFDEDDATAFWPIFNKYDAELAKIGDSRVNLIVDYAKNYDNLTDEKADELISKAFALESDRALLKKKYFDEMKPAISAIQAARFFQIENQIQDLLDLRISAELPIAQTAAK
jgi:hypothetical protein